MLWPDPKSVNDHLAPFEHVEDELLRASVTERFPKLIEQLLRLKTELKVDSYAAMKDHFADVEALKNIEDELKEQLQPQLCLDTTPVDDLPKKVLMAWLKAVQLEPLYHQTVGSPEDTWSSLQLKNYPKFKVSDRDKHVRTQAFDTLITASHVQKEDRETLTKDISYRKACLDQKLKLVAYLRMMLDRNDLKASALKLLDSILPHHPFVKDEVDLVCTPTGLYFCFPDGESLKTLASYRERTDAQRESLEAFIKDQSRFKFEQFEHFPMFSAYDARDACPDLIQQCCRICHPMELHEVVLLLNTVITFETTQHIEKYLIHDTWGHIWQHDLTDMNLLYDEMANLNRPIAPCDHVTLRTRRVVAVADLFVIDTQGGVSLDEGLKNRFIQVYLERHIRSIFAPIVAELTADMVEFFFWSDDEEHKVLLPSSSLFKNNPAKLDFAWMDMNYFCKRLRKIQRVHLKSEPSFADFCDRLTQELRRKFSRKFEQGLCSSPSFRPALEVEAKRFLEDLQAAFDGELQHRSPLPPDESCHATMNTFDRLLSNSLRIQFVINDLIKNTWIKTHPEHMAYRELLILFVVTYFCDNPTEHFWGLDETIAQFAFPLTSHLQQLELSLSSGCLS